MNDNLSGEIRHCIHFPSCGGCDLLNISYNEQLQMKQRVISDLFRSFAIPVSPVVPSPECYYYRHKVQLSFELKGRGKSGRVLLGCCEANSHRVVDQNMCLIQDRDCSTIVRIIREWAAKSGLTVFNRRTKMGFLRHVLLRRANGTGEILIGLVTNGGRPGGSRQLSRMLLNMIDNEGLLRSSVVGIVQNVNTRLTNVVLGNDELVWWGRPYIKETMGKWRYKIGLSTFFQVNPYQTPQLYDEVLKNIPQGAGVIDCYCGVGGIALWISERAKSVLGVDENRSSIQDARTAASLNGADNVIFKSGDVEREILKPGQGGFACAVLDPPRDGLTEGVIKMLDSSPVKRIIYVSCNAQTLRRDISGLQRSCRLSSIRAFDMFPHTEHIECVAVLDRITK